MRVLVFAPDSTGHHFYYVRLMLHALLELTSNVTLVIARDAKNTAEYQVQLQQSASGVRVECTVSPTRGSPVEMGNTKLRSLVEQIENLRPDHVLVPAADHLTQVMGLHRARGPALFPSGVELEGLMMRGGFAYRRPGRRRGMQDRVSLWAIEKAPWTILHYADPIPFDLLRHRKGPIAGRVRLMPDAVDSPPPVSPYVARRQLSIPEDGRYVGSAGLMDTRKGIDLLIAAFATGALGCDCRLLLAGLLSPDVQSLLIGPMAELVHQERIIVINRYLDDSELHAAMSALDVVCTPYPRHIGSASIVIRAAAAGRPVVASDFGWLGMVVPRFNLGWLCDDSDPRSLGSTIGFALQRSSEFRSTEAARRFVSFHSVENFQTAWTVRLRERLGLPVMPIEPSWDAVLAAS